MNATLSSQIQGNIPASVFIALHRRSAKVPLHVLLFKKVALKFRRGTRQATWHFELCACSLQVHCLLAQWTLVFVACVKPFVQAIRVELAAARVANDGGQRNVSWVGNAVAYGAGLQPLKFVVNIVLPQ